MQIKVKLFGSFRIERFRGDFCEYPDGVTVREIVRHLGIAESSLGFVLLNGQHADDCETLHEGDLLSLTPRVGGG